MNDLFGVFLSYYYINSFEFLLLGLILLLASLLAVNLNKFNRVVKSNNYYELLTLFDFFNDFTKFIFMRKQNLVDQSISNASTRIFKKKIKKITMIQKNSLIKPSDNCGVLKSKVFHVYKGSKGKLAFVGDFLKTSSKLVKPENPIKKKNKNKGYFNKDCF